MRSRNWGLEPLCGFVLKNAPGTGSITGTSLGAAQGIPVAMPTFHYRSRRPPPFRPLFRDQAGVPECSAVPASARMFTE